MKLLILLVGAVICYFLIKDIKTFKGAIKSDPMSFAAFISIILIVLVAAYSQL